MASLALALLGLNPEDAEVEIISGGYPGDVPYIEGPFPTKAQNVEFHLVQYGRILEKVWLKKDGRLMSWAEYGELVADAS